MMEACTGDCMMGRFGAVEEWGLHGRHGATDLKYSVSTELPGASEAKRFANVHESGTSYTPRRAGILQWESVGRDVARVSLDEDAPNS